MRGGTPPHGIDLVEGHDFNMRGATPHLDGPIEEPQFALLPLADAVWHMMIHLRKVVEDKLIALVDGMRKGPCDLAAALQREQHPEVVGHKCGFVAALIAERQEMGVTARQHTIRGTFNRSGTD